MVAEKIAEAADAAAGRLEPAQVPHDLIEDAEIEGAAAEVPVAKESVQTVGDCEEANDDAKAVASKRPTTGILRPRVLVRKPFQGYDLWPFHESL